MKVKLSRLQARLYAQLVLDEDVAIEKLHEAAYPAHHESGANTRTMQQRIGPVIAEINRKQPLMCIRPGDLKRTYRLTVRKRK